MNNQVYQVAAESAQHVWVMGAMTVLFMICFAYWVWWAYAPSRKNKMEEAGKIPFSEDETGE